MTERDDVETDSSTDGRRSAIRRLLRRREHRSRRVLTSYPRATLTCALALVLLFATTAALSWQRAEAQDQTAQARARGVDVAAEQAVALDRKSVV